MIAFGTPFKNRYKLDLSQQLTRFLVKDVDQFPVHLRIAPLRPAWRDEIAERLMALGADDRFQLANEAGEAR